MVNILICKSVWYYSSFDEDLFFEWIKKIPAIIKYEGKHDELLIYVQHEIINDNGLRELLALFYRYKIDMNQLAVFFNNENRNWFFDNKKAFWYRRVFGLIK